MKTYKALSLKVVKAREDIIRTSGLTNFNTDWFSDGATPAGNGETGGDAE